MKILHTADWHIGRMIRGRSRADEHVAVLAEIAQIARDEAVDLILVVGDVFDTAAPAAESERIAYRALLDLASTGAPVIVLSGNHDNERRLAAVAPVLELGRIETRSSFLPADEGGVVSGTTGAGERWNVASVPFLSQRWVVKAADLLDASRDAARHGGEYAARVARLVASLTAGFSPDSVNLVAAHLHVAGGVLGGGERSAHTIFEYAVDAQAFPGSAHYVALGHLHRAQAVPGPCPIRYSGSPLQLDFGEVDDTKSATIISARAGAPAEFRLIPLTAGRRLRTVAGTLEELASVMPAEDDWLKVVVREAPRSGLADDVRALFPGVIEVVVEPPQVPDRARPPRQGTTPHELFAEYLHECGIEDPKLTALFARLLEAEVV